MRCSYGSLQEDNSGIACKWKGWGSCGCIKRRLWHKIMFCLIRGFVSLGCMISSWVGEQTGCEVANRSSPWLAFFQAAHRAPSGDQSPDPSPKGQTWNPDPLPKGQPEASFRFPIGRVCSLSPSRLFFCWQSCLEHKKRGRVVVIF